MKEKSIKNVAVLGSGAWGTVIASMLADANHNVKIYGVISSELISSISLLITP